MSANINANVLRNFIVSTIGADKLAHGEAQRFGIKDDNFDEANENDNNYLEIEEILDNDDLYDKFATMFVEEQEKKEEAEEKEDEKNKVQNKSGAGAA